MPICKRGEVDENALAAAEIYWRSVHVPITR